MSETRLITIDAETVERIRAWAKSAREEVDAARSILAAWEEGTTEGEAQTLITAIAWDTTDRALWGAAQTKLRSAFQPVKAHIEGRDTDE